MAKITARDLADAQRMRRLAESGAARAFRELAGLSQENIAAAIPTTPSAVSRWETNRRVPRVASAARWYRVLVQAGAIPAKESIRV